MSIIGNLFWIVLVGFIPALLWLLAGLLLCVTIIGIPFGLQCFKFARLTLIPFGAEVNTDFSSHPIMNLIWLLLFGWGLALYYCAVGLLFFITIIGIPFGFPCFKLALLAICPFGAKITNL